MRVTFVRAASAGVVSLGLALAGCVDTSDPTGTGGIPGSATIRTTDNLRFVEPEVQVVVGGTVTWISNSSLNHSVTPLGHELWDRVETEHRNVVMLEQTFPEPGVYEYRCDYHWQQGMVGRIIVLPP